MLPIAYRTGRACLLLVASFRPTILLANSASSTLRMDRFSNLVRSGLLANDYLHSQRSP